MAVQKILLFPHPLLKKFCRPVEHFDVEIANLVQDLLDTMHDGPGSVGVAAPQIGVTLRLCVVDVSKNRQGRDNNHGLMIMVNPEIFLREGAAIMREGCMSVPDYTGEVERATRIVVHYQDQTGAAQEVETSDFEAVAIQHELDHLDGLLFLDRIVSLKTGLFRRKNYT